MKKKILATIGVVAFMYASAIAVFAETATVIIGGGTLSVTAANVTLPGVTLDGTDQTTTSLTNAWSAIDGRGTGLGWHLTIASTDFTTDTVQNVYNDATSGSFTLTYDGQTTSSINFDETAANVETTIEALSNVTAATVTGTGVVATPWVIRFDTATGQNIMTADDGSMVGGTSTVTLQTIDISVSDQEFSIQLDDGDIDVVFGNTQPTSSVTTLTGIGDATVTFLSAAVDEGMGTFNLDPDFTLEVRAEVYAGTYVSTLTVSSVAGP